MGRDGGTRRPDPFVRKRGYRMRLTSGVKAGHTVVTVAGDVDYGHADEFRSYLNDLAGADVPVVVDLTDVTFMDSTALGVLVRVHKRFAQRGNTLVLVCPDNALLRLFHITALDGYFTIAPTLGEALP
jgi:anti-sigma B factor antagonist